jgi:tetratricopeptide (TPR) repeat protein
LGNALLKLFRIEDAMASFRRALEIRPDFAEAAVNLGNAQRSIGRLDEAVAGYRRALLTKPDFVAAHTELGLALRLQRRAAESEAACRRALEINPDSAAALSVLADLRADAGRFAEAEELFKRVIAIDPKSSDAWAGIARLRKMTAADGAWLAAAQGLVEQELPPQRELSLRYAIGKYYDDVRDFEKAFQNYRRANELSKHCGPAHDATRLTRNIDLIIRSHDRRWVSRARSAANPSMRPVFIVGMLRSGTSLAEQILASHPAVFGAGELTFWGAASAANIAAASALNAPSIDVSDATLARLADDYLGLLQGLSADALRMVDKLPTNFLFLGLIHAALPNARIIHMRRNPIDTCLSIYFQHFEAANTYVNDLDDLAHYYREYRRLMRHWRTILPAGIMLEVPYEGLVLDLPVWSRRMLDFIELPWDPRCLDFHQTARTVVTASRWQVRQKISTSSVERWRHYEKYVGPLKSLLESRTINPP